MPPPTVPACVWKTPSPTSPIDSYSHCALSDMLKWVTKDRAASPLPTALLGNIADGTGGSLLVPLPRRQNPRAFSHLPRSRHPWGSPVSSLVASCRSPLVSVISANSLPSASPGSDTGFNLPVWSAMGPVSEDPLGLPHHDSFLPHRPVTQCGGFCPNCHVHQLSA